MSASASKKVIIAALIGNSAISVTKFFAAFMTGSSAMLSEGIHSLVNISIRFKREQLTSEIESVIQEIHAVIKAEHTMIKRIFVEAESA